MGGPQKRCQKLYVQKSTFPNCFCCFMDVHKLDFLFRILSELRLSKDVYIFKNNHFKHLLGKRGSRVLRPHSSALMTRGEKTHGRFPLVAPLFPSKPAKKQNAAHAKKQDITQYATTKDAKVYTKSLNKLKARLGISAAHAPNLS